MSRLSWFAIVTIVLFAAVALCPAGAAFAEPSLDVTDGSPVAVAYPQINPGKSDSVNFTVTPSTGWSQAEGTPPGISAEWVHVSPGDTQTTILGVTSSAPGGQWEPDNNGGGYFVYDGGCPASAYQLFVSTTSNQIGSHSITASGDKIVLSDGENGAGTADTEYFDVQTFAVDIQGPPNVIDDNGPATSVDQGGEIITTPPPNVDSTYKATASGGSGDYRWSWTVPSAASYESGSYSTSDPIVVFGTSGFSPIPGSDGYGTVAQRTGIIFCTATDQSDGAINPDAGKQPVQLLLEYVTDWTSEWLEPSNPQAPYDGSPVGDWYQAAPNQSITINVSAPTAVTWNFGGSVSGPIPISDLNLGASFSTTYSSSSGNGSSSAVTCPAEPTTTDWQTYLIPMVQEIDGTGYQWGPNGLVGTDALKQKRADGVLADAWSNHGQYAVVPATVPVSPIAPWW